MSRLRLLPILAFGLAIQATPATAQSQPYSGAFERVYPEAAELLRGFEASHAALLERLFTNPTVSPAELEGRAADELRSRMLDGADRKASMQATMPRFAAAAPRLAQMVDRAHALHWELYDIYADARVSDKQVAAEAAIDRYLSQPELAFTARPKSMMMMNGRPYSMAFRETFPKTNGLMWASHWLQLAVYDPLMYYADQEAREEGVEVVLDRFEELVESAPETTPQEMPTPAAISPELVRRHPRAAAIFDNLHMLHDVLADLLVHRDVRDKQMAVNEALEQFTDEEHLAISDYDWLVMSLRHGIFYQGGPAIGRLERPERNTRMGHGDHAGGVVMPGMPGPSGGGGAGGGPPMPQDQDAPGGPHTNH